MELTCKVGNVRNNGPEMMQACEGSRTGKLPPVAGTPRFTSRLGKSGNPERRRRWNAFIGRC